MKRVDLIKTITGMGGELVRHGAKHDWYRNPTTGALQAIPRHREVSEHLARRIIRILATPDHTGSEPDEDAVGS